MDGHQVDVDLRAVSGDVVADLDNFIGPATRKPGRFYLPGNAVRNVMTRCIEQLRIDGRQFNYRKEGADFPLLYDEEGNTLAEIILCEILKDPRNRILLRPKYRDAFEEYLEDTNLELDTDPTESPTP